MVDHALALAARGIPVFPLVKGGTTPRDKGFYNFATTDPVEVRRLWGSGEWNVGVSTGNGLVGVDVDVKGGKDGEASFDLAGFPAATFTVRTRSGGFHYYYRAGTDVRNGADILGPGSGLDIRGHHGFLVGPGSVTETGVYTVERDAPISDLDASCLSLLKTTHRARTRRQDVPDDEAARVAASAYLIEAPAAIEGQSGDATTFKVACAVRDCGVSADTCLDLMLDEWNFRCVPEWEPEALERKVMNAYAYASGSGVEAYPDGPGPIEVIVPTGAEGRLWYRHGDPWVSSHRWLVYKTLPAVGVALLVGPSGSGKSFLSTYLSECVATGQEFFGNEIEERGGTIILAGEAYTSLAPRLSTLGDGKPLPISATPVDLLRDAGNWHRVIQAVDLERAYIRGQHDVPVRIIIVDTIPASGLLEDENDNVEVTAMMKMKLAKLAEAYECLVIGLVHPPKSGGPDPRGGGAFRGSADYVLHVERAGKAKVRKLEITKSRDDSERVLGGFSLRVVEVGRDHKDRPIETCVVEASTEAPRGRAPSGYDSFCSVVTSGTDTRDTLRVHLADEYTDEQFEKLFAYGLNIDYTENEHGILVTAPLKLGA